MRGLWPVQDLMTTKKFQWAPKLSSHLMFKVEMQSIWSQQAPSKTKILTQSVSSIQAYQNNSLSTAFSYQRKPCTLLTKLYVPRHSKVQLVSITLKLSIWSKSVTSRNVTNIMPTLPMYRDKPKIQVTTLMTKIMLMRMRLVSMIRSVKTWSTRSF